MSNRVGLVDLVTTLKAARATDIDVKCGRKHLKISFKNQYNTVCYLVLAYGSHRRSSRAKRNITATMRRLLRRRPTVPADVAHNSRPHQGGSA